MYCERWCCNCKNTTWFQFNPSKTNSLGYVDISCIECTMTCETYIDKTDLVVEDYLSYNPEPDELEEEDVDTRSGVIKRREIDENYTYPYDILDQGRNIIK